MKPASNGLAELIASLSAAEQRYFQQHAQRHTSKRPTAYHQLYEVIQSQPEYNEARAREALGLSPSHFAVVKRQLYEQLLDALCIFHRSANAAAVARRLLAGIHILLEKGLVQQAAQEHRKAGRWIEARQLLEFKAEWLLTGREILEKQLSATDAGKTIMDWQSNWSQMLAQMAKAGDAAAAFLKIALAHYQKIRPEDKAEDYNSTASMLAGLPHLLSSAHASTRADALRAYATYHFMQGQPKQAMQYNQDLVSLFEAEPFLLTQHPSRYAAALQNLLIDYFQLKMWAELEHGLKRLQQLPAHKAFKRLKGLQQRLMERSLLLEANMAVSRERYESGKELAQELAPQIRKQQLYLSYPNQQSLLYLLSLCQLLARQAEGAQGTLQLFMDRYRKQTLQELFHFARLLQLLIHFSLGHTELLPYLLQAFRRSQSPHYPQSTRLLLSALQKLLHAPGKQQRQQILHDWKTEIASQQLRSTEARFYEYLPLQPWMVSVR